MPCSAFHSRVEADSTPEKVSLLLPPNMIVAKVEDQATSAIFAVCFIVCDPDSFL